MLQYDIMQRKNGQHC